MCDPLRSSKSGSQVDCRDGISRVEVLIAILIAGLFATLVIGAANRLREHASAISCQGNLKQLGLAVHNYHDTTGKTPPLADQGEGAVTGTGLPSMSALLIPYIEATTLIYKPGVTSVDRYNAHSSIAYTFHDKFGAIGTDSGGIANHVFRGFLDPSDQTADGLRDIAMTLPDETTGYYATASYAANGLLPWGQKGIPQSLAGSTSNTIMIAERPQVCVTASGETVFNLWGVGFYSPHMPAFATLTPSNPPGLWSTDQVVPSEPFPNEESPDRDAFIRLKIGRQDAESVPNDIGSPVQILRYAKSCDPRLPGSPHRDFMQVMMADGSVRRYSRGTSAYVFWAACIPATPTP